MFLPDRNFIRTRCEPRLAERRMTVHFNEPLKANRAASHRIAYKHVPARGRQISLLRLKPLSDSTPLWFRVPVYACRVFLREYDFAKHREPPRFSRDSFVHIIDRLCRLPMNGCKLERELGRLLSLSVNVSYRTRVDQQREYVTNENEESVNTVVET